MYKIDLEHEMVNNIVKDVLVKDYKFLCEEIRNLHQKGASITPVEEEDLRNNIFFKNGLGMALYYYLSEKEAQQIIREEYAIDFIE